MKLKKWICKVVDMPERWRRRATKSGIIEMELPPVEMTRLKRMLVGESGLRWKVLKKQKHGNVLSPTNDEQR